MYGMILMAALTTGTDLPDFGRWGWRGYYGGWYGPGYVGWGGWGWGRYGWPYRGYGWGGYGWPYGGYSWGSYGWPYGWARGGYGWSGYPYYAVLPYTYSAPTYVASAPYVSSPVNRAFYYNPASSTAPAQGTYATVIVHLPADAILTVDGQPTHSTSGTRQFVSPPLEPGKTYHYAFKGVLERSGEKVTASQNVHVRAGKTSEVYMDFPVSGKRTDQQNSSTKPAETKELPDRP